eukprot:6883845-Pyramimonas_sp.AAC.1
MASLFLRFSLALARAASALLASEGPISDSSSSPAIEPLIPCHLEGRRAGLQGRRRGAHRGLQLLGAAALEGDLGVLGAAGAG